MKLKPVVIFLVLCSMLSMTYFSSLAPTTTHAQDDTPPFPTFADFQAALDRAIQTGDSEPFWQQVESTHTMPLTFEDTAVFLYRGEAEKVEWRGDWTGWEPDPAALGERQGDTDIWLMVATFPRDARLDYKIVLNDAEWILDPLNPNQQLGGFGPNSELRMPDYVYPQDTLPRPDVAQGALSEPYTYGSRLLDYGVHYQVYTPADYADRRDLPTIYVTDGHEYNHPDMGSMVTVLDNLIAEGKIEPIIAVFIDPRDPQAPGNNRRQDEFLMNPDYADFIATELVPTIDALYRTRRDPAARAILGTSFGGVNSTYLASRHPETFGLIAIQSPAYWIVVPEIMDLMEAETLPLTKIFLSMGSIADDHDNTRQMRDIFEEKGYDMWYIETPEGHSWGNWRALLDDLLIYFFGPAAE